MEDIIKEINKVLSDDDVEGDVPLSIDDKKGVPIYKDNFSSLPDVKSSKRICFVDGGNSEILGAANFSLQFMRVASVTYTEKKRTRDDFFVLITFEKNKFKVQTFPEGKLPDMSFDSLDKSLRTGNERILARKIGDVCRRIAELQLASKENADYVVIDGDLTGRTELEKELLEKLRNKNIAGLSKTSHLLTEQGRVLTAAISSLKEGEWIYHPVFENTNISFAKLHNNSKYVFRLDSFCETKELISLLKNLSSDPVFLGYPYGLIEVDKLARVTNNETNILRTKFMAKFGKDWSQVKTYLRTKDAHEILDSVR